ncbi:efflux RND transporter periplasmic adaptor subunit [Estrella lausannensis]|uniref:Uncharacterized protein n=1 Tax=Estrella lausannensis TaxID=483423 RepID=A0A0H5DR51_9BACT|nr:efflux RND transporter periplasmic adaptor subunit [Estrella lausannensis]CRX38628.1 hypothetical protein ELAC_1289 [Estrella lausannensis]
MQMLKQILKFVFYSVITVATLVIIISYIEKKIEDDGEITLYGNVDVRQVDIAFRVPGRVSKLYHEEGDLVSKGAILAELERDPYDQDVAEAEGNLAIASATLENASVILSRRKDLIASGGVAQEDLDRAASSFSEALGNHNASKASLLKAKDRLSYTEVYAPTEGIILARVREPGSVVKESDPVYTLSITSPVWIRAFVAEPLLGSVFYGMEAEITTDSKGAPAYTGKVGFISPVAEFTPKTVETTELRTDLVYRLRIYVDNPDGRLKQGMPVTVTLHPKRHDE